ncbi:hypothetical protein CLV30_109189 [Haloactinopolyspora alba]|uniref:Phage gp6-like head-tail connector protein n=1 Tax=Haloactinopolyspora alba TaxID=648780 RepID=A0A2P8E082_9ACTN|nr:hypothetical protein [Haloactinopolyspora alba]PSL02881.1 hypothetical protein CLV30_109189 [Haloactinopolyspora alba]
MAWAEDYVTAVELRDYMRFNDSEDDVELALAVSAASRAVDNRTNRQFGKVDTAEERTYAAEWDRRRCRWLVEIDDVQDTTGLTVQTADGAAVDSYALEPVNAKKESRPYTRLVLRTLSTETLTSGEDEVTVSALWGWTTVPDAVKQATLLQASRFFTRRNAPFGVAGSPETGSEMRLLARVDPDVAVALSPYVRWWGAA